MRDVRINRQAIKALVNSLGRTKAFLWDLEVPGFGVYKTSKGRATFVYQYRSPLNKSVVQRIVLGRLGELSLEQARDLAREHAYLCRTGIDPRVAKQEKAKEAAAENELRVPVYVEDYIARRKASQNPVSQTVETVLRVDVIGQMGDARLDKITYKEAEAAFNRVLERAPSAGRSFIVYLKALINDAISRELMTSSPVLKIETPPTGERDRVLSHIEMQRYLEGAHDIGDCRGDIYELLLRLLRRRDEVTSATWEEIDQDTWIWTLPAGREKTGTSIRIPLPPTAVQIFEKQQPNRSLRTGYVFSLNGGATSPSIGSKARKLLDAAMDRRVELAAAQAGGVRLKIPDFTIHDTRTTAATVLGDQLGIEPHIIEVLLNHKLGNKVQRIYQRSTFQAAMREALLKWDAYLNQLLGEPSAWPGGIDLPPMDLKEINRRAASMTADWPRKSGADKKDDRYPTTK